MKRKTRGSWHVPVIPALRREMLYHSNTNRATGLVQVQQHTFNTAGGMMLPKLSPPPRTFTSKSLEATDMLSSVDTHFAGVTVLYDRKMTEDGASMSDLVTWLFKSREGRRPGNKLQNVGSL